MPDRLPQIILQSVSTIPLPPLPQVLVRFLALLEEERTPLSDFAEIISQDPALTAHILTVATSPRYRRESAGASLQGSLAAIGIPLLRSLAGCLAARNNRANSSTSLNIDHADYWRHSLQVAVLARSLAEAAGYPEVEEAYLAGLLHDIGQLIIAAGVGDYGAIIEAAVGETGQNGLTQVMNGIDQAAVAARLADSWQLSSFLADAILFQHFPVEQIRSAEILCKIVWSAHRLSELAGGNESLPDLSAEISAIPAMLDIKPAALVLICHSAETRVTERATYFGLPPWKPESVRAGHSFISLSVTVPQPEVSDAAALQLETLVRIKAALQPLQQALPAMSDETDVYGSLREIVRLLFGLQQPVFLMPLPDRAVLVAVPCTGQPSLLARLEIASEHSPSLAATALQTQLPCATFDDVAAREASLIDIQLCRLLGSQGLLCIPMYDGAGRAGVMTFGLSEEQYAARKSQLQTMTAFAQQATRSLEAFRTYRQGTLKVAAELGRQFEHKTRKVVHEAANPLGIINSYLAILAEKLGEPSAVQQELTILKEEIGRVGRIIRGLNEMSEQPLPVETVNVNALIEGMLVLYGESLFEARGIDVDKQLDPGLPHARGDRDSLKQILLNIWKNASEAMPAGGSFRISTGSTGKEDAGCRVEIRLGDSGPGLPEEVKERLFQPLSADRHPVGSGVGLSIVASLVERLGGQISCQSAPGEGTTFVINLAMANKEIACSVS